MKLKITNNRESKKYVFDLELSKQNIAGYVKFDIVEINNKEGYVVLNIYKYLERGYKLYVFAWESVTLAESLEGSGTLKNKFELIYE